MSRRTPPSGRFGSPYAGGEDRLRRRDNVRRDFPRKDCPHCKGSGQLETTGTPRYITCRYCIP
jgi:ribosomal protein L37AE/L43A